MTALLQEHFFLNDSNHTLDMADSVSDSVSLSSFDNASTHSNSKATIPSPEDKKVRAKTKKKRNRGEPALEQQEQQRQDHEPNAPPLHATRRNRRRNNENGKDDMVIGTDDDNLYLIYDDGIIANGFPFVGLDKFQAAPTIMELEGDKIIFTK